MGGLMFKVLSPDEVKTLLNPYRLHGPLEKEEFDVAQEVIRGEILNFPAPLGTATVVLEGPQNTLFLIDNDGSQLCYWVATSFDSTDNSTIYLLNRMELGI